MEDSLKVLPGGTIQFSMRKDFPTIAANKNKNKKKTATTKTTCVKVTAILSLLWFKQM